jgi:ABC-2 type transport system ATP-binding protein
VPELFVDVRTVFRPPKSRPRVIEVVGLTQHYGIWPVLKDIDLLIDAGELVAIIGPNGMGKTTLLATIAGVHSPRKGYVEIAGLRRRSSSEAELEIRSKTIYLPADPFLPKLMSPREFWISVGKLYGVDDERLFDHVERLVALFELQQVVDSPISSGSTGQQKKVALAAALITEAPLLLLDEPFAGGLDPSGILALRKVLQRLSSERKVTIVMTAPVPELVEQLATRVVVLRAGEIIADATIADLKAQAGRTGSLAEALETLYFPEASDRIADYFRGSPL